MEKRKKQNRFPRPKGRGSLFLAQNSLHPRHKCRGFFAQNKKAEREFFDNFDREGGYDAFSQKGYQKLIELMQELVAPKNEESIVDMGCGTGRFTYHISKAFPKCRLVGMDISKGSISRATQDFRNIEFKVADAEATELAANSVNIICYTGILHHFPDFQKVAKEAFRILALGGRFFSYDPNYYNPAFWLYRSPTSPFYSRVGITANERLLKASEVEEVFSQAGFISESKIISGIPFTYIEDKKAQILLGVYNTLDQIMAMTPLVKFIGSFVIGYGIKK